MDWSGAMCPRGLVKRTGPRWTYTLREPQLKTTSVEQNMVFGMEHGGRLGFGADGDISTQINSNT